MGRLFERLLRASALASGALLAGIALLTVFDVARRYLFNAPLVGGLELTELGMLCLVMLALPWCAASDGHVRIDLLDRALGTGGLRRAAVATESISLAVLCALAGNTALKAADAFEYDDRANTLLVPLWPFYALIAASFGAYALIVLRNLLRR